MIRFLAFSLTAALFFALAEHSIVQAFWPNAYLDSSFFFYPGIAASLVLAGAGLAFCGVLAWGASRVRPALKAPQASVSLGVVLVLFGFVAAFGENVSKILSSAYTDSPVGRFLAVAFVALVWFLLASAVFLMATRPDRSKPAGKAGRRARIWIVPASLLISGILTAVSWRALYDMYLPLHGMLFTGLLVPVLTGRALYAWLAAGSQRRLDRLVRVTVASGLLLSAFAFAGHQAREAGAVWPYPAVMLPALGLAGAMLAVSPSRAGAAALPGALVALLLAAPWVDDAWRPRVSDALYSGDHVLLISVDTLRRDALSAYNPETWPTPHIDALLADGLRYTRAWSPSSWTLPSVVSIMTGVSPALHQADDFDARVPANLRTLAQGMKDRGYAAEAMVENLLLGPDRGMARGFDHYIHLPSIDPRTTFGQRAVIRLWPERFLPKGGSRGIVEIAWRRIRRHRDGKLFLWLHLFEPHSPYEPPARFWPESVPRDAEFPHVTNGPLNGRVSEEVLKNEMYDLYLAEVQYVDFCVGLLVDRMKESGAYDRATIVFTSDHGEEFAEHGRWGHGNTPVESLIRMPLGLKSSSTAAGTIEAAVVDTAGFAATLLRQTDESFRPSAEFIPAWPPVAAPRTEDEATTPPTVFSTSVPREYLHEEALVFGDRPWKYIFNRTDQTERLYDLKLDPGETAPVSDEHPDLLARGRELYRAHHRQAERLREQLDLDSQRDLDYSEDVIDELRKLGYMN